MCSVQNGINRFGFGMLARMPMAERFLILIQPGENCNDFWHCECNSVRASNKIILRYHSAKSQTLLWDVVANETEWQIGEQIKPEKSNGIIT